MGNEATKEPVIDFEELLPGQTVAMGTDTTNTTLGVIKSLDDTTATISSLGETFTSSTTDMSVAVDEFVLAEEPRAPYESCYEEAAVAWLKTYVQEIIADYEESSLEEYKQNGPTSPKQKQKKKRGSRRKSGSTVIGANESDAVKRTKIMLASTENESLYLGFISMTLPKNVEKRMDIETWKKVDLAQMGQKIHESLVWRYEREAHALLDWKPPDDLTIRMPGGLLGVDKAGRPALYFCACHVDFDNLTGDEIEKIEIRKQQQINVALRDSRVRNIICIVNVENMGMSVIKWVNGFKRLTWVSEQLYPGRTWKSLVINVSSSVKSVYNNFVAPFLSAHTKSITTLCIKGEETISTLKEYLPDESIPLFLGGTAPNESIYPGGLNKNAEVTMELFQAEQLAKASK